jgi:hypothetical protein
VHQPQLGWAVHDAQLDAVPQDWARAVEAKIDAATRAIANFMVKLNVNTMPAKIKSKHRTEIAFKIVGSISLS